MLASQVHRTHRTMHEARSACEREQSFFFNFSANPRRICALKGNKTPVKGKIFLVWGTHAFRSLTLLALMGRFNVNLYPSEKCELGKNGESAIRVRHLRSQEMKLRGKQGKAAIQKPLCRLCECPTSDGHVLAAQVDRIKLKKWAMKIMNLTEEDENLPDVVGEDALICYFCIWQAEFGDESGDEAVAWWPKNLDLEKNARVLRDNYSVGEVEQCWVQLEEVDLAKYEKEIPQKRKVCLYCGNNYNQLMEHVKLMHKEAIKCGILGCTTYFHTKEEKEQHMQEDLHSKHKKSRESQEICCAYCEKVNIYSSFKIWRRHMNRKHPELPVACSHYGCKEYFKSKSAMILHFNSLHKQAVNQDLYLCKHCEYFATHKTMLRRHEEARHMPKIVKCDSCDAKFGSKWIASRHYKDCHTFKKCKSCGQDVPLGHKARHRKPSFCSRCKLSFECSGLYQSHRKSCRKTLFTCKECGKTYSWKWKLNGHVKKVHTKTVIFRCDQCDYSAFYKAYMEEHMQWKHLPKSIKCDECNTFFPTERFLKNHKRSWHEYIHCAECGQEVRRQYMLRHRLVKTCRRCKCKLKCTGLLAQHIKNSCAHKSRNNFDKFYCDKCPRIYVQRKNLYAHIVKMHIDV